MYDWLAESIKAGAVVTANRRLARLLKDEHAAQQQRDGLVAWTSPEVDAWQDWLVKSVAGAKRQASLPTRINAQQSQWLWEQCWRQELGDQTVNIASLVRLSRDAWQRLADWQLEIADITTAAQNDNQRTFAAVASRYLGLLNRDQMIDDAGMGALLLKLIRTNDVDLQTAYTFAGFERRRPVMNAIEKALEANGIDVRHVPQNETQVSPAILEYENSNAEFRAAGAWARRIIEQHNNARVAIIANDLETDGDRIARQVRDGATPGWQHGQRRLFDVVNVSYGRRLSDFPAIAIALTLLRWLIGTLPSRDVSLLLRSPLLGTAELSGRSRLELALRQMPDRAWTPSMLTSQFRGRDESPDAKDWLTRVAEFSKRRREVRRSASPAEWAIFLDDTLKLFGWPGASALDSDEFQLVNRWRELLNEFARLSLVSTSMAAGVAVSRLELMAGETVFQPESRMAKIHLMGPLEASGAEFDAIWISGLSSSNWPPAGSPSVFLSRRLQEKHGMPDSTPDDTARYAEQVLSGLLASAAIVQCSYATSDDDIEQTATDLLAAQFQGIEPGIDDPGLYAAGLTRLASTQDVDDPVPGIAPGEQIFGGAAAIQNQMTDPVTCFVTNRMGARRIYPQAVGIPAPMRGNLIHDALHHLYAELPTSAKIAGWNDEELSRRIGNAVDTAFVRHEKNADGVLHQVFALERRRLDRLLRAFVAADCARDAFTIASVEGEFEFADGNIHLTLRFDRLDRFEDDTFAILDYKTGSKKRLLNREGEAQEIQLFVYAAATDAPVSALALVNIDSREISFDGAGRGFTNVDEWPQLLDNIKKQIGEACVDMSAGDVRINIKQGIQAARPLNLLTRYTELRRDTD